MDERLKVYANDHKSIVIDEIDQEEISEHRASTRVRA